MSNHTIASATLILKLLLVSKVTQRKLNVYPRRKLVYKSRQLNRERTGHRHAARVYETQ